MVESVVVVSQKHLPSVPLLFVHANSVRYNAHVVLLIHYTPSETQIGNDVHLLSSLFNIEQDYEKDAHTVLSVLIAYSHFANTTHYA